MIYTITLNPSLDYFMDFSFEEKIKNLSRTKETKLFAAGKGINASILLKNLGSENISLIISGGLTGEILRKKISEKKLPYKNFDSKNNIRINVKLAFGETYEFLTTSINKNKNVSLDLLNYLSKNLNKNDYVMVMGSQMENLSKNIIEDIFNVCNKKGSKIIFDFSGKKWIDYLKYKPFLIKPNISELGKIFDVDIKSVEDIKWYSQKILNMGAQNIIVSHDKNGAYFFNENKSIFTNPLKIKLVNGSGAGDSMLSGFVHKYIETNSFEESINFGNASGSGTASVITIAEAKKINELYKKVSSKKI